ncbi:MAG TPA: alpha/beta hydrolase [Acetobacteraceae bacterium]|jgi:pimeloyl-ACP methyl ester carboxylesterase
MQQRRVNGYDMAYIELGNGAPLVCVHGTLGDFRVWSPVLGPLSRRHRMISLSLRHFFPEHWDGVGSDYTIAQHVADVIGFIEVLDVGPVDLMGHSRGGHIAFRVAQQRPDLLRRLVLAEPGGDVDASLAPPGAPPPAASLGTRYLAAADRIRAGDIEGGLTIFCDIVGLAWANVPATVRQTWRDNARTLLGQINEQRQPFSRGEAEAIRVPTLFVGGGDTPGQLPAVLRALAGHVRGSRTEIIPNARHFMFEDDPAAYCAAVLGFLG